MNSNPPKFLKWILERFLIRYSKSPALGDLDEEFDIIVEEIGLKRARKWYRRQVMKSLPSFIGYFIYWSSTMFLHYVKTTLRNMNKHKGYTFINVAGLSIGLTCVLFVLLYVRFERSYDDCHENPDSIFRVSMEFKSRMTESLEAMTYSPMRNVFKDNYPAVLYAARVRLGMDPLVKHKDRIFYETHQMWTDTDLFQIFYIPFINGDPNTALDRPNTVVITRRIAKKYFDRTNVVGSTLNIDDIEYEITGVVEECPRNTHLKYELLHSFKDFEKHRWTRSWSANMVYNYIRLRPGINRYAFESQIRRMSDRYAGERDRELGYSRIYSLTRIKDIHLHSHMNEEIEPPGNPQYLVICTAVGVLILLIASLNFINLSTALSVNRAGEVGMRKVVGAFSGQLIVQFLGDALLFAFLALFFSLLLTNLFLPSFNMLTGLNFTFSQVFTPRIIFILLAITVVMGVGAGSYPAFFLSRFKPISTLKGDRNSGTGAGILRKILVVGQFSISVILIICTLMVYRQLDYMKNANLGFQPEQKLMIPMRGGIDISENYTTVKHALLQHPSIIGAAASSYVLGGSFDTQYIYRLNESNDRRQVVNHLYVDTDYLSMFEIELAAGRYFQKQMLTDPEDAVIINKAMADALGFLSPEEAIGKQVESGPDGNIRHIIGVTKDFHYKGLTYDISPLVMKIYPQRFYYISLLLKTQDMDRTLFYIDDKLKTLFPDNPLEPYFLDGFFENQYRKEEQVGRLFGILSFIGLFIAALGLLGLTSFAAARRRKEIGIRKVLGSTVPGILALLTREFMKLILLSNLIAWPLAYYFIGRWLLQFPYRTRIDFLLFIASAGLILVIAGLSVSYQSIKAAIANPVDAIKYE